jgi:uncharacterized protein (DUF3084 family)
MSLLNVSVRLCPFQTQNSGVLPLFYHTVDRESQYGNVLVLYDNDRRVGGRAFAFDSVFDNEASQLAVFDNEAGRLVDAVFRGDSAMLAMHGLSNAAKKFTLEGPPEHPGLFYRCLDRLFTKIDTSRTTDPGTQYTVKLQCFQIVHEQIKDLLALNNTKCKLRDDTKRGIMCEGATEMILQSATHGFDLVSSLRRESHKFAHTVFAIVVERTRTSSSPVQQQQAVAHNAKSGRKSSPIPKSTRTTSNIASLSLVNIAYPEVTVSDKRDSSTSAWWYILRDVVSALESRAPYVQFHKSKLTLLMRDMLNGRHPGCLLGVLNPLADTYAQALEVTNLLARLHDAFVKIRQIAAMSADKANAGHSTQMVYGAGVELSPRYLSPSRMRPEDDGHVQYQYQPQVNTQVFSMQDVVRAGSEYHERSFSAGRAQPTFRLSARSTAPPHTAPEGVQRGAAPMLSQQPPASNYEGVRYEDHGIGPDYASLVDVYGARRVMEPPPSSTSQLLEMDMMGRTMAESQRRIQDLEQQLASVVRERNNIKEEMDLLLTKPSSAARTSSQSHSASGSLKRSGSSSPMKRPLSASSNAASLRSSRDNGVYLGDDIRTLKERLAKAESVAREYDKYRQVMESSFVKMREELTAKSEELELKDKHIKAMEKRARDTLNESQKLSVSVKDASLKAESLEGENKQLQKELKHAKKDAERLSKTVARVKQLEQELQNARVQHEAVQALERQKVELEGRLSARDQEITNNKHLIEKLLADIKGVKEVVLREMQQTQQQQQQQQQQQDLQHVVQQFVPRPPNEPQVDADSRVEALERANRKLMTDLEFARSALTKALTENQHLKSENERLQQEKDSLLDELSRVPTPSRDHGSRLPEYPSNGYGSGAIYAAMEAYVMPETSRGRASAGYEFTAASSATTTHEPTHASGLRPPPAHGYPNNTADSGSNASRSSRNIYLSDL